MSAGPYREPQPRLQDPPREVPRSVAVRVRFGGALAQFGWGFSAVGLVLFFTFLGRTDFGGPDGATASGTVTAAIVRWSGENNEFIHWKIEYSFVDEAGRNQRGRSYSDRPVAVGQLVPVIYAPGKPERSHVEGMRSSPEDVGGFLVTSLVSAIFVVIGGVLAARRLREGKRVLRLLRTGRVGYGRLVRKRPTKVSIENRRVYEMTFEFE